MNSARQNVVYDLTLFEEKEKLPSKQNTREERKQKADTKSYPKPAVFIKWTAIGLLVMLSLASIMICNVQISHLSLQVTNAQHQLQAAKSEEIRLNMQLESRSSLNNVESYAQTKLGLQKVSSYQLEYIHTANTDKVEINKSDVNIFTKLINAILEYL